MVPPGWLRQRTPGAGDQGAPRLFGAHEPPPKRENAGMTVLHTNEAATRLNRAPAYEYRHTVLLDETNAVGNVYFAHYLHWQGHCREMFLRQYVPEVVGALDGNTAVVTTRCSCEYFAELFAFDDIVVRMRAGDVAQSRIVLLFDYWRVKDGREELVARGEQQIAWLVRNGESFIPDRVPPRLIAAIDAFVGSAPH
jgi:enediyne biosynthesis thioesterase